MPICQNCGKLNKDSSKYCAEWGSKIVTDNIQHDYSEEYNPAYGKLTRKMENRLNNINLFDKFIDKTSNFSRKFMDSSINRKYIESIEPECIEVYNTIDDDFLKVLFIQARFRIGGGGNVGTTVISSFSTPTKNLSYEDSIKFYQDLLNKIKHDLDIEKQKPNFSEEEYYKKRWKNMVLKILLIWVFQDIWGK